MRLVKTQPAPAVLVLGLTRVVSTVSQGGGRGRLEHWLDELIGETCGVNQCKKALAYCWEVPLGVPSFSGVQASSAQDLLCQVCRHARCDMRAPEPWTDPKENDCERCGPWRMTACSTVHCPTAIRDYTLRTFTSHDAPEPAWAQFGV